MAATAETKSVTRHAPGLLATMLAIGIAAHPVSAQVNEDALRQGTQAQAEVDKAAADSQKRIDGIQDKIGDAARNYAQAVADAESLERYNKQLAEQVKSQEAELSSIERQLRDIETTTREVQPLMDRMVSTLEQYVALDVPYYAEDRKRRVENLKANLARADITVSEKYRAILEAYQIELEYGRTLGTYEGKIGTGAGEKLVQFVQLGSVGLLYQTHDGQETGYWDAEKKQWVQDNSQAANVTEALRVAKGRGAAALLIVPVKAPQGAK